MTEEQRSEARREFEGIRDERGRYANTATRIGNALLHLLELIGGGESGDYLSKTMDDVAQGRITFLKGIRIGIANIFGWSEEGNITANDVTAQGMTKAEGGVRTDEVRSTNYTGDSIADTGFLLSNNINGHSKLTIDEIYVRMRAVYESLEVKRWSVSTGDEIRSCAANIISRTEYLKEDGEMIGYRNMRVPWMMNGMVFLLSKFSRTAARKVFSAIRKVRVNLTPEQLEEVKTVRCYFLANDGDTEIENWWQENDLVRCQTMNIVNTTRNTYTGTTAHAGDVLWWRKCKGVSTEPVELERGKKYHYIDIAYDKKAEDAQSASIHCMLGSDIPAAGDHMVQFGNTVIPGRMNLWIQMVNGGSSYDYDPDSDAPCIKGFKGIYTFDLSKSWFGGHPCKMTLAPGKKYEFYGEEFRVVKEYGTVPIPTNRGLWTSITPERDDYTPHGQVRKCYYYDEVSHKGCLWRCSIADGAHWVNASGNYISDAAYTALSDEQKVTCERKPNYTSAEPSENSGDWIKIVERGTSIKTVETAYAKSDQGSTPPSSGWVDSISSLKLNEGDYLWTRTITTYSDALTPSTTYSVSRWGIDGDGISSINVSFAESATLYSLPSQAGRLSWKDDYSSLPLNMGDYVYTRYTISYDKNSTPTVSYMVNRLGEDGVGYVGTEEYYALSSSQTEAPSGHPYTGSDPYVTYTAAQWKKVKITGGWSEQMPDYQQNADKYLWNFEVSFDTEGKAMVTKPICIGNYAKGIQSIVETYTISKYTLKADMLGDTAERNAHPWTDEVYDSAPTDALPYQWNWTRTTYSDGTYDDFYHISAVKGTKGEDGNGIVSMTCTFAISSVGTVKSETTEPSHYGSWSTAIPVMTDDYPYLWRREVTVFTDSTKNTTKYYCMGCKGATGSSGPTIRGPREWSSGSIFYNDGSVTESDGIKYIDIVLYNGAYYRCARNHTSASYSYPGNNNATSRNYWVAATQFDFVATNLILANYAKISNLGAEAIEMISGSKYFIVKAGEVKCNTGKFENVEVKGTIYADSGEFKGDIIVTNGTNSVKINSSGMECRWGNDGIRLNSNGLMRWHPGANSWVNMFAGRYVNVVTASSYLISVYDDYVVSSGNNEALTLPAGVNGKVITIKTLGHTVRVYPGKTSSYAQQILVTDHDLTEGYKDLNNFDRAEFVFNGMRWYWNSMGI